MPYYFETRNMLSYFRILNRLYIKSIFVSEFETKINKANKTLAIYSGFPLNGIYFVFLLNFFDESNLKKKILF
jgi:hypothetical protein